MIISTVPVGVVVLLNTLTETVLLFSTFISPTDISIEVVFLFTKNCTVSELDSA